MDYEAIVQLADLGGSRLYCQEEEKKGKDWMYVQKIQQTRLNLCASNTTNLTLLTLFNPYKEIHFYKRMFCS